MSPHPDVQATVSGSNTKARKYAVSCSDLRAFQAPVGDQHPVRGADHYIQRSSHGPNKGDFPTRRGIHGGTGWRGVFDSTITRAPRTSRWAKRIGNHKLCWQHQRAQRSNELNQFRRHEVVTAIAVPPSYESVTLCFRLHRAHRQFRQV